MTDDRRQTLRNHDYEVLRRLEALDQAIGGLDEKLDLSRIDIAKLQVKSSMAGTIAGLVGGGIIGLVVTLIPKLLK